MDAVVALRAFNRFHTRFVGALGAHYLDSPLTLAEARLLYEIATREEAVAVELQAELGLDPGYASRILRRFQDRGWITRQPAGDARRRTIRLTEDGTNAFTALDRRTRAEAEHRLAGLGAADRETLVAGLASVQGLLGGGEAAWQIRTFRSGDLPLLAARQAILYAESHDWGRPMEVLLCEVVTAFLRDFKPGREQCWIAERAGMMAGSVLLVEAEPDVAQLRLLYVEPWCRGLGIGHALVEDCVRFAREAGYARIRLWTHTVLASARRIYEGAGFRITQVETHDTFGQPEQGEVWELDL